MNKKLKKSAKKHNAINYLKGLAGMFPTKGKLAKRLLAERARDKVRENKVFS